MATWLDPSRPKLPPGSLLAIADDLLADIYTIWLHLEDVCRLDSAICVKWLRHHFLRLVSTKVLRFLREEIVILDGENICTTNHRALGLPELNWISKRGIHLASIRLTYKGRLRSDYGEQICDAVSTLVYNEHLNDLEMVDIKGCSFMDADDIVSIITKSFKSIKFIDIRAERPRDNRGIPSGSMWRHIKRCSELAAFAPEGTESLEDLATIFKMCQKLRMLNLTGFKNRLTDEDIGAVAGNCRLLESFNIEDCAPVSDDAITLLAMSCRWLCYVNLSSAGITDAAVISLCVNCPYIEAFYLAKNILTDAAVHAIATNLPGLLQLGINRIDAITSAAIVTLAKSCRGLIIVNLEHCDGIDDIALMAIGGFCMKLEQLSITGCTRVTNVGLRVIAKNVLRPSSRHY